MAAKKRSTRTRGAKADVEALAADAISRAAEPPIALPDDPAELRRRATMALRAQAMVAGIDARMAKHVHDERGRLAELDARARAREAYRPPADQIRRVSRRLTSLAFTLEAINRAVPIAQDSPQDAETVLLLIAESARSVARSVDAAIRMLDNETAAVGVFDDDLED